MNPEDDPDLFQCSICGQFRDVNERHIGNGHTHPGDWCDDCAGGPGLWRMRTR